MTDAEKIEQLVEQSALTAIEEKRLVGAVVIVAKNGQPIIRRAFGKADREKNIAMTPETNFRLASFTKPIISVATMALVEQNKIKLDEPITNWLPDFRPQTPSGATPEITIRHLLTHTAGLNYRFLEIDDKGPYNDFDVSDGLDHAPVTLEENLKRISRAGLLFAPGSGWRYSVAFDVLGAVLEKATKLDLADIVRRYVTHPLQMNDTEFWAVNPEDLATPYYNEKSEPVRMKGRFRGPTLPGAGSLVFSTDRALDKNAFRAGGAGMIGTADDFVTLLEVLRGDTQDVLEKETLPEMFRNQTGDFPIMLLPPGYGFGLGFAVVRDSSRTMMPMNDGSIQWGGAYGHSWFVDPKAGLSVVALTNTAPEGNFGQFPREIKFAAYGLRAPPLQQPPVKLPSLGG